MPLPTTSGYWPRWVWLSRFFEDLIREGEYWEGEGTDGDGGNRIYMKVMC